MHLHVDLATYPPTYRLSMGAHAILVDFMRHAIEYFICRLVASWT